MLASAGITAHLKNGGTLEKTAMIANHASTRTTQLYDRRSDEVSLDEVEPHQSKRDHREVMSDDDDFVLRPGPNFDLLNPVATQAPASAPERDPAGDESRDRGHT
jgi:hypothetical protein